MPLIYTIKGPPIFLAESAGKQQDIIRMSEGILPNFSMGMSWIGVGFIVIVGTLVLYAVASALYKLSQRDILEESHEYFTYFICQNGLTYNEAAAHKGILRSCSERKIKFNTFEKLVKGTTVVIDLESIPCFSTRGNKEKIKCEIISQRRIGRPGEGWFRVSGLIIDEAAAKSVEEVLISTQRKRKIVA